MINQMNSSIINQNYENYNLDGYISINDDLIGRIVMFKICEENDKIITDFKGRKSNKMLFKIRR